jgi:serine/threonine protein kinase
MINTKKRLEDMRYSIHGKMLTRFHFYERLSAGAFGQVFRGQNILTGKPVAIKVEAISQQQQQLKHECKILYFLRDRGCLNVPEVEWWSTVSLHDGVLYRALAMPLLEPLACSAVQDDALIRHWIREMIRILYQVHDAGIIHRDVKPQNFMLRNKEFLYLIDFGLSSVYVDGEYRTHLPARPCRHDILGTPKYVSVNVHDGRDPSRRDDLVSVGYVWLYLLLQERLPWDALPAVASVDDDVGQEHVMHPWNQERKRQKLALLEHPSPIQDFLLAVHQLDYDERPDYAGLVALI